ncbi:MAG: type IV secretory system conjugative DNA transfer family protein [Burkholderiales bacterium]|nr:type IV secretory system conjugative DNA transfer family protein [Burkholderiales bacterium]
MRLFFKVARIVLLNRASTIIVTPLISIGLVYIVMNIAMEYVRNYIYDTPWFKILAYTPREIYTQMIYLHSIKNNNFYNAYTLKTINIGEMVLINSLIFSVGLGACLCGIRLRSLRVTKADRYGSSRWATEQEIKERCLLDGEGVVVGAIKNFTGFKYLQHNGPEPIMGIGPTRSGKGVGWVIPTLLKWKHSAIIYDPKGENWDLTALSRRKDFNGKCLRFAPGELQGSSKYNNCRFNCLDTIKYGTLEEVSHADTIATIICDTGEAQKDYWEDEAKSFIKAVILHIVYTKKNGNLTDVSFFISKPPEEMLHDMLYANHAEYLAIKGILKDQIDKMVEYWGSNTNKNIRSAVEPLYSMLPNTKRKPGEQFNPANGSQKGAEGQLQGIIGSAKRFLSLYQDPIVAGNIAQSDFKLEDLYNYEAPVSLYIVVSPSSTQQERLRPLVRLLISLVLDKIQENSAVKKHKMLFMIDEFPTLKKMGNIEHAISTISAYDLKFFLILQSMNHLQKFYGEHQTLYANSPVRLIYSSADPITRKMVSSDSGDYTYRGQVVSHTKSGGAFGSRSTTTTMQDSKKPLVTPDEVGKLPSDKMFIFIDGMNPINCYKANYRKDATLLAKTMKISYDSDILLTPKVSNQNEIKLDTSVKKLKPLPGFKDFCEAQMEKIRDSSINYR